MMRTLIWVSTITVICAGLCCGILYAEKTAGSQQESAQTDGDKEKVNTQSTVLDTSSIKLDNIEIQGRVEKPQTVFILPGKDPEVDTIQIDRSFFREIFRKVERDMLQRTSR